MNNEKQILDYLYENEDFFISVFDKFEHNYNELPSNVFFKAFFKSKLIDSLIAYTDAGYFYPFIKSKYIEDTLDFLKNCNIFSLYGKSLQLNELIKKSSFNFRNQMDYYFMKLVKDDFAPVIKSESGYKILRSGIKQFNKLKELQFKYHKEEVYINDTYYPYDAEMSAYKKLLEDKLNYSIYDVKTNKALSKANINAESPNYFQIGGIYTDVLYRGLGLAKMCLSGLINDCFTNYDKKGILLYVKKDNINAISVYKKLGFKLMYETKLCYF